jgi:3-oxoadipyl-CoA thiolase
MRLASEAYLLDAVRTPIGRLRGALSGVRPDDLAAGAMAALLGRVAVDPVTIEDVILGCANQAGEDNRNVARMALLLAGLPQTVPGVTVNRLCGSGLEAVVQAARAIRAGEGDLFVAGGVESMSRAPWAMAKPDEALPSGPPTAFDTALGWRFPNKRLEALFPLEAMGVTAENVARRDGITREAQDAFALESQRKAVAAQAAGHFAAELVPVEVPQRKGPAMRVERDEGPRADSSLEGLAKLKAAFIEGGTVTAGNSSTLNDGASLVLVASGDYVRRHGLTPMARIVASGHAGVDPRYMGIGPVPASQKALARAGLTADAMDLVELNEAFAAQSIACVRGLALDPSRVNVSGGAIALGHPLGMSGARILTTLVHGLARTGGRHGLATMCIGVGQGIALVVERV